MTAFLFLAIVNISLPIMGFAPGHRRGVSAQVVEVVIDTMPAMIDAIELIAIFLCRPHLFWSLLFLPSWIRIGSYCLPLVVYW